MQALEKDDAGLKDGLAGLNIDGNLAELAFSLQQFQAKHFASVIEVMGGGLTRRFLRIEGGGKVIRIALTLRSDCQKNAARPGELKHGADMEAERTIWSGSSSQIRNLHIYILCALLCWLIVPIFVAIWKWIELRARHYELTTQRIRIRQGIFSKRTDELELYRVNDVTVYEPFWQRLFGLGNIKLTTHDLSTPSLTLEALPDPGATREHLRSAVEECRDRKKVRIAEME